MNDNKFWLSIVLAVVMGITAIVWGSLVYNYKLNVAAFEKGYAETTVAGCCRLVWQPTESKPSVER